MSFCVSHLQQKKIITSCKRKLIAQPVFTPFGKFINNEVTPCFLQQCSIQDEKNLFSVMSHHLNDWEITSGESRTKSQLLSLQGCLRHRCLWFPIISNLVLDKLSCQLRWTFVKVIKLEYWYSVLSIWSKCRFLRWSKVEFFQVD